ncbi:transmembrane protein 41B isoform X1 [Ciona intestinalis]
MLGMDWYKKWLWIRSESLLPTTNSTKDSEKTSYADLTKYFNTSNLVQRLWRKRESFDGENDANNNQTLPINVTPPSTPVGSKNLMTVSYPAYLNSGCSNSQMSSFPFNDNRRSSLLEGLEHTLYVMSNDQKRTQLTLPKSNINYMSKLRNEPELSQLPVPIPRLHKFRIKGPLYGYLDEERLPLIEKKSGSTKLSIFVLVVIFVSASALIYSVYNNFPELEVDEKAKVKLPRDMEDAKELGRVLSKYKDMYYYEVTSAFFITYIFLQTFAIPGSVFLSILSGFLYPFYIALFLVCLCSGIGATGCYMISFFIGKPIVDKYLSARVQKWNEVVDGQREHLFNYLLFLRITPFLPNWFINIVSPVIHIPVSIFFFATFIGVAPLSFIAIQAGTTLYQLTTAGDAFSWTGILVMAVLAVLSLLPVVFKNRLKNKYE